MVGSRIGFGSEVIFYSKQSHDVRVSALLEKSRDACRKDKGWTVEVKSQKSGVGTRVCT